MPFEDSKLVGDSMSIQGLPPHVLLLHGAGVSNRERWQSFRDSLLARGIGSCAFDFIGHGETGGAIASSSLKRRTDQAIQFIRTAKIPTPLTLIGSSMGAYTALKVSQFFPVDKLIFLVPGMYSRDLYNINFGDKFSEIIRKNRSWENSDAWEILSSFTGEILVIGAEKDETVPRELTQKIYDSAVGASSKELYFVPGSSHGLGKFLEENEDERNRVVSLIAKVK